MLEADPFLLSVTDATTKSHLRARVGLPRFQVLRVGILLPLLRRVLVLRRLIIENAPEIPDMTQIPIRMK